MLVPENSPPSMSGEEVAMAEKKKGRVGGKGGQIRRDFGKFLDPVYTDSVV